MRYQKKVKNALGLGHLENDEKRLSDKLSESPGLAQPIVEAQVEILGLLHNPCPDYTGCPCGRGYRILVGVGRFPPLFPFLNQARNISTASVLPIGSILYFSISFSNPLSPVTFNFIEDFTDFIKIILLSFCLNKSFNHQEQLARLKDMMKNIFGPKPQETEVGLLKKA